MDDEYFNKWVNFFSNHMQVGTLVIDRNIYYPSEQYEIRSAIGLVVTLMGHTYDWVTDADNQWFIHRLK